MHHSTKITTNSQSLFGLCCPNQDCVTWDSEYRLGAHGIIWVGLKTIIPPVYYDPIDYIRCDSGVVVLVLG